MIRRGTVEFLERRMYRRRRLVDAIRLLPIFAALLFFAPVLWSPQSSDDANTASWGLYLFFGWGALVVIALVLSTLFARSQADTEDAEKGGR